MARKVKCKYCGESIDKTESILNIHKSEKGREYKHYYCKSKKCYERKQAKNEFVNIFYDYANSKAPPQQLYKVFNKMMSQGLSEFQCLFVMKFIRDKRKNLNHPWGITYYINEAYNEYKRKLQQKVSTRNRFDNKNIEKYILREWNYNKREDRKDISEFI